MPRYLAKYAHESEGAAPGLQHGWGSATITTDRLVTTDRQRADIAAEIGRSNGFTKVVVLTLAELDDDDGLDDVLRMRPLPELER